MDVVARLTEKLFGSQIQKMVEEQLKAQGTPVLGEVLKRVGDGRATYIPDDHESYIKNGYLFNPDTYSIISFIAQKASNIPFSVYQVKDEKALQLYKSAGPDETYAKRKMRSKAMNELKDHELQELFIKPNEIQGWAEFIEQGIGFKLSTGNTFIHAIGPENGVNKGKIKEMWILPTQAMNILAGNQVGMVRGYQMKTNPSIIIDPSEIIHLKYWTPEYVAGSFLWGLSPIRAARRVISRSNASYDSSVASFQNMGALGFVSSDSGAGDPGLTPEQAKIIEDTLATKTGPKNRGKYLVTSANLKWQQMGMSPVDLAILESDKVDLRKQCNIFHVPSELFGDTENKTYSNTKEAGRAIYTNAVIPALSQFRDMFNQHIAKRYAPNIYIDFDTSMLPEMQEDINTMITSLQGAWWLTGNEKREMMVWPKDETEAMMETYLIPMGLVPMGGYMPTEEEMKSLERKYGL
jgi:HK97 family phage portal protein